MVVCGDRIDESRTCRWIQISRSITENRSPAATGVESEDRDIGALNDSMRVGPVAQDIVGIGR